MRTKLMASVAVALMGMGVTAFASSSPYQAVVDNSPILESSGNATLRADAADVTSGVMLGGLVHSYEIGAGATATGIANLANGIIDQVDALPAGTKYFYGDEAYGLARTGAAGVAINESYDGTAYTNATTLISDFYNTYVPTNGGTTARANNVVSPTADPTAPDAIGIFQLSYHVLASDLVGSAESATYRSTLAVALANLNTTTTDAGNPSLGDVSTTQALAVALWALAETGATGTGAGSGSFANSTLADLRNDLLGQIDGDFTLFQKLSHAGNSDTPSVQDTNLAKGYAEDMAYAILALKALGNPADTTLIQNIEYALAAAINNVNGTPLNVLDDQQAFSAQYAGAALLALPEPATLSLLALGGLGLLARRRRLA